MEKDIAKPALEAAEGKLFDKRERKSASGGWARRRKGIAHAPAEPASIDPAAREALLRAIARARGWVDAILASRIASFEDIAAAEGLTKRHVRRLAPLAFLSPRIIAAIVDGDAPVGLTVSRLTQALPHAWSAQEQMLGMR